MVNALVIFYEGTKPTKNNVEALANGMLTTSWCDGVTEIKHFDSDSISRAILDRSSKQEKEETRMNIISISTIDDVKRTQAAHRLESILNITFAQALAMLEEGKISVPVDIDIDDITRIICDGGGHITHGPSEYAVSQAVYYMNSFSDRLWDLVDIGKQIHNGVITKETEAVKNAIEILNSKSFDGINRVNEKVRTLINIM
jgi:hypothetical protein